ncbi:MAG: right-handed parallel beta-helix repeat-containing protein, partial [Planctomycetota bacterium]
VVGEMGGYGEAAHNLIYDNATGVNLTGTMQLNEIYGNTVGVVGSGTLGGAEHDRANLIHDNGTGVAGFDGVIRFNRIYDNTTGIDAAGGSFIHENVMWGNAVAGVRVSGASDVVLRNNTIDALAGDAVHLTAGASNVSIIGNILWAHEGYDIYVANDSQDGFWSDYNDLHATGTGALVWWTRPLDDLLDWQEDVWAYDFHSVGRTDPNPTWSDPHFVDPARGDYRVHSPVGGLVRTNPTVGTGDPLMDFRLRRWAYANLLPNPGFEDGLNGWDTNPEASVRTAGPDPYEGGGYYFAGSVIEGHAEQSVDLTALFTDAELDTGQLRVAFGGYIRSLSESTRDQGRVELTYLDAVGDPIGAAAVARARDLTSWEFVEELSTVPAGTRSVTYRFVAVRKYGTENNAYLDAAFLYVFGEVAVPNQGAWGNVTTEVDVPPATVHLTFPWLYTDWENFRPREITWRTSGNATGSQVRIELWQDNPTGPKYWKTIADATPDDGSYTWIPLDDSAIDPGTYDLRIEIKLIDQPWVYDQSVETFTAPEDTTTFYVDDADETNALDDYTPSAFGDNRNTGRLATAPKPNPLNILRIYQIDAGDYLFVDTGTYPLLRTVVLSGEAGIADDEGLVMIGPRPAVTEGIAEYTTAIPDNTSQDLLELYDADFVTIRHLTLTGGRMGLYAHDGSLSMTATHIVTGDNAHSGVYITGGSQFDLLDEITTFGHHGSGHYGLYANGGAGGTISHVTAYDNRDGMYLTGVGAVTLSDVAAHDNDRYGAYLTGMGAVNLANVEAYGNSTTGLHVGAG